MNTTFNTEEIEMAGKRKNANPNETKEQKLARMVALKVPRILKAIEQLGGLSKYGPSVKQRDYVFDQLKSQVEYAHGKWSGAKQESTFQFPTS